MKSQWKVLVCNDKQYENSTEKWKANEKQTAMKSNMEILQGNEKQPMKSTDQQWKVVWKFYGKMKD